MEFSEKLNYLFDLTKAEGKQLAKIMNVTPPQISKMRKGIRGLPRRRDTAMLLARFFAQRSNTDYQRDALSKKLKTAQIRNISSEADLTEVILNWLSDEQTADYYAAKRADHFLRQFDTMFETAKISIQQTEPQKVLTSGQSSFFAYYGNDGKRLAVQTFLHYLLQQKQAYTINVLTDESIAWITDDPSFSKRLTDTMLKLTKQGCTFRRIAGPILDMDQAFDSLNRWFPLYMTGHATSYYYKRMRDNLNRVTLFVVPDVAVMFAFSVGNTPQRNMVTFFTIDSKTVNSMAVEFENYFAMCEPIMNVYSTANASKQLHTCMLQYEGYPANCLQRSDSLSFITLPWDIAMNLHTTGRPEEKNEFLTAFAQRYKKFKANIEQQDFVDIIRLADADAVVNGIVSIPAAYVLGGEAQYYTPEGYLQHLRSILYLLEHRRHYHVVLRKPTDRDSAIIYVKEGYCVILARDVSPFSIFEVSERYLVDAFAEYLRRLLPNEQEDASNRRIVIKEIRALMEEIEQQLMMKQTVASVSFSK